MTWAATCHLDGFGNGVTFIKETFNTILPRPLCDNADGFTLFAGESVTIAPGDTGGINTCVGISLPEGFYARISNRTGTGISSTGTVSKDVINVRYTKCIRVVIYNHGFRNRRILVGDAIAVITINKCFTPSTRVCRRLDFGDSGNGN